MGELVFAAAFNSIGARDLFYAPEAPEDGSASIQTATSGTADTGNRVIESRIAWKGLILLTFAGNEKLAAQIGKIGPGLRFGADPLLIEMNHTAPKLRRRRAVHQTIRHRQQFDRCGSSRGRRGQMSLRMRVKAILSS